MEVDTRTLPNPALLKDLYAEFYAKANLQRDEISSHWREYASRFDVRADQDGNVNWLGGTAFGNGRWGRTGEKIADVTGILLQWCLLPRKAPRLHAWDTVETVVERMGLDKTFDAFRLACVLEFVTTHLAKRNISPKRILLIGDGFGTLGSSLAEWWPESELVFIDLGETLLFQSYFCQKAHPAASHDYFGRSPARFQYLPAGRADEVRTRRFDLALNVASMQEMPPASIANYFSILREVLGSTGFFYCCNREKKVMPGGEVTEFKEYPWQAGDEHLADGPCEWNRWFVAIDKFPKGPTLFGKRIPFINYYAGAVLHRLTRFCAQEAVEEPSLSNPSNPASFP